MNSQALHTERFVSTLMDRFIAGLGIADKPSALQSKPKPTTMPATRATCSDCGRAIPPLPLSARAGDPQVLCVRCRYSTPGRVRIDDGPSECEVALDKTAAPTPPLPPALELIYALEEVGALFKNHDEAVCCVDKYFDLYGISAAADALGFILARLPGGRRGTELRIALLAACGVEVADDARRLGIAPSILHRAITRLRQKILGKHKTG